MSAVPPQVICLITAPNPVQAHRWERALRAAGIKFQVQGDFLGVGYGDASGIQPEIWVRRQDFLRARRALRQGCPSDVADSFENSSFQSGMLT